MIEDDVIRAVREAREKYARLHNFSIREMVADLQARDLAGDWPVVSLPGRRPSVVGLPPPAATAVLPFLDPSLTPTQSVTNRH